ncbi:MAG TPA: HRDC domain-containing protein, partial [Opitutus sp.]|nr:HRDC domain-containing protein [Opitutus sp.]
IGKSERLRGRGLAVLHAVWHWREAQAKRIDTAPFKVCGNELLLRMAGAAEAEEATPESVLAAIHLGRRHDRLASSLAEALRAGFARDPKTLPRRPGRDPRHAALTQAEVERLDRIKEDRDRVAARLELDPTLIASRSQLAQIARAPVRLDEILLRWQADLLRDAPSLKS